MRALRSTNRWPEVGRWIAAISLSRVLLPEPLRPMRPIDSPRPIRSDTSRRAQNSSIRSWWPRWKSPRKWTFSDPDGLCRRMNRFERSRASTMGIRRGAPSGLLGEAILEGEQQGRADGEGDYRVRDRERPDRRLGPAAGEKNVLLGCDVGGERAGGGAQPEPHPHLLQLV